MKRHIHFPARKFMGASSPRDDCGLRLCLCHSYSAAVLSECTGLTPLLPHSLLCRVLYKDALRTSQASVSVNVLGTEGQAPVPHGVQMFHVQVVMFCISMVSWRDSRRIRAAQKGNNSQSFASVPPSQRPPQQSLPPEPHHWHFTGFWAHSEPHLLWGVCTRLRTALTCVK